MTRSTHHWHGVFDLKLRKSLEIVLFDAYSGALASSLPCSWTSPPGAGVEPGEDLTYKSAAIIHQACTCVCSTANQADVLSKKVVWLNNVQTWQKMLKDTIWKNLKVKVTMQNLQTNFLQNGQKHEFANFAIDCLEKKQSAKKLSGRIIWKRLSLLRLVAEKYLSIL